MLSCIRVRAERAQMKRNPGHDRERMCRVQSSDDGETAAGSHDDQGMIAIPKSRFQSRPGSHLPCSKDNSR